LEFHDQRQSLLGNLAQADTSLFVSFATFCEKCFWENRGAPGGDECKASAFAPYLTSESRFS
jgi:hypothetical protein